MFDRFETAWDYIKDDLGLDEPINESSEPDILTSHDIDLIDKCLDKISKAEDALMNLKNSAKNRDLKQLAGSLLTQQERIGTALQDFEDD